MQDTQTATTAADALPPAWSPDSARDRLSSTLFLAALFHAVLILGVTFSALNESSPASDATSLEVVIVTREYEEAPDNTDAKLLAEQNLAGSGTTTDPSSARMAMETAPLALTPGEEQEGELITEDLTPGDPSPVPVLTTDRPSDRQVLTGKRPEDNDEQQARKSLMGLNQSTEIATDPDLQTVIPVENKRELLINANTRESSIAAYLDGWKRKIERVGTMHFPDQDTLKRVQKNPTLEVAINSQGELSEVRIRRSSGDKSLDMAAIEILRISSPFEPFPEHLRNDYDVLRFAYEWQFTKGVGRTEVSVSRRNES